MDYTVLENKVLDEIEALFKSFKGQFSEKGISYSIQLKRDKSNNDNYFSEIEILFNKDGNFIDVIEFFVVREGKKYIDENNLIKELYLDIEGILSLV